MALLRTAEDGGPGQTLIEPQLSSGTLFLPCIVQQAVLPPLRWVEIDIFIFHAPLAGHFLLFFHRIRARGSSMAAADAMLRTRFRGLFFHQPLLITHPRAHSCKKIASTQSTLFKQHGNSEKGNRQSHTHAPCRHTQSKPRRLRRRHSLLLQCTSHPPLPSCWRLQLHSHAPRSPTRT